MEICRIIPESPFHIGAEGIGVEKTDIIIRSDTMAGGIMAKYYELTGSTRKMDESPIFVISSAFPYCNDILFLPKPLVKPKFEGEGKKLKDIKFLSEAIFIKWINGENITLDNDVVFDEKFLVTEEEGEKLREYLWDKNESAIQKIFSVYESSHNLLDRETNRSEIFYLGEVKYNKYKGCGLYLFLNVLDDEENVKKAIRMLGEDGIGGKRTWGMGQFKSEFETYKGRLDFANPKEYFITLSLYIPEKFELQNHLLDGDDVAYNFERRGGWVGTPEYLSHRKRSIRMFTEGSVFKNVQGKKGKIVDVRPQGIKHPVYKYGLALKVYKEARNDKNGMEN